MSKQRVAVRAWLDGSEQWNWIYLGMDGKLYIRQESGWDKLDNHVIDKACCELDGYDLYVNRKECTT